jgi:hypothetical protein
MILRPKGLGSCLRIKGYFFIVEIVKRFPEILPLLRIVIQLSPAWNVSRIGIQKSGIIINGVPHSWSWYSLYKSLDKQPHLIGLSIVNCFVFSKIVEPISILSNSVVAKILSKFSSGKTSVITR